MTGLRDNPAVDNPMPMLIDTDPGVDDALALLMAFEAANREEIEVVALTVAAGNVGLRHTVANALKLCEVAGVPVPVHAGCAGPLLHAAPDAAFVHGRDGFGDIDYAPAITAAAGEHAALAISRYSRARSGQLQLVMLGPLTNLALALKLDPELPQRIARIVVMGGAVSGQGNTTVAAEFNIGFDPEAAHIVFEAFAGDGTPGIELVDWEVVLAHGIDHGDIDAWLRADSERARFFERISRKTRAWSGERRGERWPCADALAMALALRPDGAVETLHRPLAIELDGRLTRGATVVDWQQRGERQETVAILRRYDQTAFEALVRGALAAR